MTGLHNLKIFVLLFVFASELSEAARKALISRVVELTDDRTALNLEMTSLQETVSRLEGRMREKEEETKRCLMIVLDDFHISFLCLIVTFLTSSLLSAACYSTDALFSMFFTD